MASDPLPTGLQMAGYMQNAHSISPVKPSSGPMMSKGDSAVGSSGRRRSSIKTGRPRVVKRAVSSPNFRALAGIEAMGLSLEEKRRNKLGYQRTAVACAHCRRRKIRCVPGPDDSQRCSNCTRLKRDCHFLPVDQLVSGGKRTRSGSRVDGTMNESETSDSSPGKGGSAIPQRSKTFDAEQVPRSPAVPTTQSYHEYSTPLVSPNHRASLTASGYSMPPMYQDTSWSTLPGATGQHFSMERSSYDPYWQSQTMPHASGYTYQPYNMPPMSAPLPPAASTDDHRLFGNQHGQQDHVWSQPRAPLRSLSLATSAGMQAYQQPYYQDLSLTQRPPVSLPAEIHQPSSMTNNPEQTPPSSDTQSTPTAVNYAEIMPRIPAHAHFGHPTWTSVPPIHNMHVADTGSDGLPPGWYAVPQGLADVKEEDDGVRLRHHHHQMGVLDDFRPKPG